MFKRVARNLITALLISAIVICTLPSCSKSEETEKIKYKKDSLRDITFEYPDNYTPDYRDDNQTSYLLNRNEGIIFIVCWDEDRKEDISYKGKLHEVNGIKGYYWPDDEGTAFAFVTRDKNDTLVEYHVYTEDKDVFWKVVDSIKIKE